jgi:hypothetical protein
MSALDIPPHSPAASRLAVTALVLIAAFALASGFLRQVVGVAPQSGAIATGAADAIAEATPVPEPTLQVAEPAPRRVRVADAAPVDAREDIAPADAVPAADAAATAPDPAPPVQPADPPAQGDGPAL